MEIRVLLEASPTNPPLTFPDGAGGYWLVPPKFEAKLDHPSMSYEIRLVIGRPLHSPLLGILQLEITRKEFNGVGVTEVSQPIHAAGLRELLLPELLEQAVRSASTYVTVDPQFGHVPTFPKPKNLNREQLRQVVAERTIKEAVRVYLACEDLPDWEVKCLNELGISRATLYRRLNAAGFDFNKRQPTKKRGGK